MRRAPPSSFLRAFSLHMVVRPAVAARGEQACRQPFDPAASTPARFLAALSSFPSCHDESTDFL